MTSQAFIPPSSTLLLHNHTSASFSPSSRPSITISSFFFRSTQVQPLAASSFLTPSPCPIHSRRPHKQHDHHHHHHHHHLHHHHHHHRRRQHPLTTPDLTDLAHNNISISNSRSQSRSHARWSMLSQQDFILDWAAPIARGSFGEVYTGIERGTGRRVVIKRAKKATPLAQNLLDMEKYVNEKIAGIDHNTLKVVNGNNGSTNGLRGGVAGLLFDAIRDGMTVAGADPDSKDLEVLRQMQVKAALGAAAIETQSTQTSAMTSTMINDSAFQNYLRWPLYLGSFSFNSTTNLVWYQEGDGTTLEDYLSGKSIQALYADLATYECYPAPLRISLFRKVVQELLQALVDLQAYGIMHRDIKPANVIVSKGSPTPLKIIDFGSSCDWNTILKRGLNTATCDPTYCPPEKRLSVLAPDRFDVYSVGLIGLRVLVPSLSSELDLRTFEAQFEQKYNNNLAAWLSDFDISSGERGFELATRWKKGDDYLIQTLVHFIGSMLAENVYNRCTPEDALNNRIWNVLS